MSGGNTDVKEYFVIPHGCHIHQVLCWADPANQAHFQLLCVEASKVTDLVMMSCQMRLVKLELESKREQKYVEK